MYNSTNTKQTILAYSIVLDYWSSIIRTRKNLTKEKYHGKKADTSERSDSNMQLHPPYKQESHVT